ncbi:acylneuraminate cytidylyltransferase family protein [Patescibacteria group bacterium]|nr:acylneuraminate cytidylyltransferase family protein [Patescibacteria group bacterium]
MTEKYKVTALLPMKGHSERIPEKNIKLLGGKPLFFHVLESLESTKFVYEIIVNTDSQKIISLIKKNFPRVVIIKRPQHLLGDKVPMTPLIEHDIKFAKTKHFLQTHAVTPLLKASTFDKAIKTYFEGLNKGADSVIGVTRYQTRFYNHNKHPINHDPNIMVPSQDMPPLYEDNSCFYINSIENFLKRKDRVGKNPIFVEISKLENVEIDEEEDFVLAEALFNFLKNKSKYYGK